MKAHLLYRDQDLDWKRVLGAGAEREAALTRRRYDRFEGLDCRSGFPWNAEALTRDLALHILFETMAQGDDYVYEAARQVILAGVRGDAATIRYRQAVMEDCLRQPAVVREIYAIAIEAINADRGRYLGLLARYPDWVLRDAIDRMTRFLGFLKNLRRLADCHAGEFVSDGWSAFFTMLKRNLSAEYFTLVQDQLQELRFKNGELISAELGTANKGARHILHRMPYRRRTLSAWWSGLFEEKPPAYCFELHPRDEAGFQALAALRNQAVALAANALGVAANHVSDFFCMLRAELAFYVGCLNLHGQLTRKGNATCMPVPAPPQERRLTFRGLYDAALALTMEGPVVGNDANADTRSLFIITGPNGGGKSTFLRGIGLAQLMMQCGMFVAAQSFRGSLCDGLFTHFKREEDAGMESGKFDEELCRMSEIADHVKPDSVVLFNESFAATNEREGSEVARQIVSALTEKRVRVFYVTHMYELARHFHESRMANVLLLRAVRKADGTLTFRLIEGAPLPGSSGEDLYNSILGGAARSGIDVSRAALSAW
jgi:hypothetical protein